MWRKDPLEEKIDMASHDDYRYKEGYWDGYWAKAKEEWAIRDWTNAGAVGPFPKMYKEPRSPYKRLLKHYERLWKRRERDTLF